MISYAGIYFALKCQNTDVFIVSLYETLDICFLVFFMILLAIDNTIRFMIKKINVLTYVWNPYLTTIPETLLDLRHGKLVLKSGNCSSILIFHGMLIGELLSGEHGNGWLVLPPLFWFVRGLFSSCLG